MVEPKYFNGFLHVSFFFVIVTGSDSHDLPPTPPSSTPSDSEGGSSPNRHTPSEPGSPVAYQSPVRKPESRTTAITAQMFTNLQVREVKRYIS